MAALWFSPGTSSLSWKRFSPHANPPISFSLNWAASRDTLPPPHPKTLETGDAVTENAWMAKNKLLPDCD